MPAWRDPAERFFEKIKINKAGCWEWTGYRQPRGYGIFGDKRKTILAHRWAYSFLRGEIPKDKELDHVCRNTCCVNPDHLQPVSHLENIRRGKAGTKNRTKTHCRHGHPYSGDNLILIPKSGERACRACRKRSSIDQWFKRNAINESDIFYV